MPLEMDRERLNTEMARLGKALVSQFFVLLKTSAHYSEGHAALDLPIANLLRVVREITRRNEDASLRFRAGHLYLGELRLKPDITSFEAPRYVMEEMRRLLLRRITFGPGVTGDDLRRFVYALRDLDVIPGTDVYSRILKAMQQRMVENLQVEVMHDDEALTLAPDLVHLEGNLKARPL